MMSCLGLMVWPAHADDSFKRPYMYDWRNDYSSYTQNHYWTPAHWVSEEKSTQEVVDGFYRSGIITDQYYDGNIPVLEVGHSFLELSTRDRHRVVAFMDYAFNLKAAKGGNIIEIYLKRNEIPLGLYAQGRLQLH